MVFQRSMLNWQGGLSGRSIEYNGLSWSYGQLEEGGPEVSLSWKLFGVMVFQRSMLGWQEDPSARSIQCNGPPWIYGQLEEGGPGSCISCCCSCCSSAIVHPITDEQQEHYTTTTTATYRYIYINCQLEEGGPEVSLSWKLFGVMVFQRSMLGWQEDPSARSIQCNGLPWIYGQLEEGGPGSCISCCCSCCSSAIVHPITDEQQEHYTTTTATYRYIYINCCIFFW